LKYIISLVTKYSYYKQLSV